MLKIIGLIVVVAFAVKYRERVVASVSGAVSYVRDLFRGLSRP